MLISEYINGHMERIEEISKKISRAFNGGKSREELKPLYMMRSAFDVSLDTSIYRIFQLKYFIEDLTNNQLTLVKPSLENWGDDLENPLLNLKFRIDGDLTTFRGIMEKYWGLCWSEDDIDSLSKWKFFSHKNRAVRIKTTVSKLLESIMNTQNIFFTIDYLIGKISYYYRLEIDDWLSESKYTDFIDSLGFSAALSLMVLDRERFSTEEEIRLLYSYGTNNDDGWADKNVKIINVDGNDVCKHPLSWKNIIEEIVFDPWSTQVEINNTIKILNDLNICCLIKKSEAVNK